MLRNIIVRLVIYYLSLLLFLAAAFQFLPNMRYYVSQQRDRFLVGALEDAGAAGTAVLETLREGFAQLIDQDGINLLIDPSNTVPVFVALTLAFALILPVTWVYRWTREPKKYSQSFLHALLVTPIGIALVVFLVKGSLPLAFGLAGIVAAVRFRATIKEPMDAVYMLMAIGIGLAAGTQLTSVAYLSSMIFVAIALGVWKSDFGSRPPMLSGWRVVPGVSAEVPKKSKKAGKGG